MSRSIAAPSRKDCSRRIFRPRQGAFTGAVGAHKGYFEQASGGALFLDEIGDLPLYQQVKLLRVLEQSTVTRLGSANEVPVDFRLVAATNKDLRVLVAQDEFRADLYYRLAVIELRIPAWSSAGPPKVALFRSLLERMGAGDEPPDWLLERVGATRYEGNVRELSNVAERVAIVRRQFQSWDRARIERIFDQLAEPLRPPAAMGAGGAQCEPPVFTDAERAERAASWPRWTPTAGAGRTPPIPWASAARCCGKRCANCIWAAGRVKPRTGWWKPPEGAIGNGP